MDRKTVSTDTDWEAAVGYSRAVQVGEHVHVAGTTATDADGNLVGAGNPYEQTQQALTNVDRALNELGSSVDDVVRTRIFVTDIENWEEIGRAHSEMFDEKRPATSMLQVERLVSPEMLVEIEAEAIVTS